MTEVLILSDSHGLREEIVTIRNRHQPDLVIHCGDSELDFHAPELSKMYKVQGNCDLDNTFPKEELFTIDGVKFFVTHGHLFEVKRNLMLLSYRAEEFEAQIVCFGHTHIAGAEKVKNQLFINPGSIHLPRMRKEATYAILKWKEISNVSLDFYTVEGKQVEELSVKTSFEE